MESCGAIQCEVSAAQLRALSKAAALYKRDALSTTSYSAVIAVVGDELTITLLPEPMGAKGRGISYVFDLSGSELKRSFVNR
jgi:hypothetical protein